MKRCIEPLILMLGALLLFSPSPVQAKKSQNPSFPAPPPTLAPVSVSEGYSQFNPRNLPELNSGRALPIPEPVAREPQPTMDLGSHWVSVVPASRARPAEVSPGIPLGTSTESLQTNLNESEDEKVYSSRLWTDSTLYGNWVDGNGKDYSSRNRGTYYEQNFRYDLFTTKASGDSLSLLLDTTYNNDDREFSDAFILNQLTLESNTPNTQATFGHAFPEFSPFTMSQQMFGLSGVQKFSHTNVKAFAGYRAVDNDSLRNPRQVNGMRLEHISDNSFSMGLNAVGTRDTHDNPSANKDLPTLRNKVYSFDMALNPGENWQFRAEYARSDTDFDQRSTVGNQYATAYRAEGSYLTEQLKAHGGVEAADTAFVTVLGESPRDQRAYFGDLRYELNSYFGFQLRGRTSRDNLDNYKRATLVRNEPEVQLTFHPSEYYKDLRLDFSYQPLHEYSDNGAFIDRYRDLTWLQLNQKAGAMRYYAAVNWTIDKDKITRANDRDLSRMDLKLTWEYDAFRSLYSLASMEHLDYKVAGGRDTQRQFGIGGSSLFHEDITLALDFLHETNGSRFENMGSQHDRVSFSVTKEYNNTARFVVNLEGSNNRFDYSSQDFADMAAKVRFLRSF